MTVLVYITAFILMLCFMVAFMNSTNRTRNIRDRYCDILVGVVIFLMFIALIKVFGGIL